MTVETITRQLKVAGDPLRLRILGALSQEELTVTELTEIFNVGQSRASGHLSKLLEEGLVTCRREGKCALYSLGAAGSGPVLGPILAEFRESETAARDLEAVAAVLSRRETGPPPGTLGRDYLPGRTWEGLAKTLLALLPPLRIADLGIGSGELTRLLACGARSVIAVDRDADVLRRAAAEARRTGIENIDFRSGDLREPPIEPGEVDVWLLSQVLHLCEDPRAALAAAWQRLEAGGRVVVLDLLAHGETWVRERLGHVVLGFSEAELHDLLEEAGFKKVRVQRVARDRKPPHFVSLLGIGER
jgi:ArsR family transcriptional regulator